LSRITEIVDLRHSVGPPAGGTAIGDEVGDARVALPPVLVGVVEALHHGGDEPRLLGYAHIPDLVAHVAEGAQEIALGGITLGQGPAFADADHGRAARLRLPRRPGNVMEIAGPLRIGDVDDRRAVQLRLSRQWIEPPPPVVPDIGDPAGALALDDGLICRARLKIVLA